MIIDHKKYDLFGKSMVQNIRIKAPFTFDFPITDNACFLYMLQGEMQYHRDEARVNIPHKHALFLNCIQASKTISNLNAGSVNEIMIVNFHPDILKRVYDREMPFILQASERMVSNKSVEVLNNNFLIEKYIEGLLFYFQHPALVNDDILVLKLKEIILLLAQTPNARAVQTIFTQLFSPTTYTFKQIIEANLFTQLSIDALARLNNLSVSSFKREFARHYNDTPANYIKTKRLEKAAELLVISTERIKDIAFNCGFNDLANFTKSFREKYQCTPGEFRVG
ncbi:AraC family transcriptional regulator [Pedobacter kyungheensis]|uniref:AraC family transcriptional regulator n=1 Tax=Pedobacter kyungheensis TaxID=1069985 RepID=A0A0C1FSM0_9SPHI|nr:AraC family transcriptional regulator [Pedobacter kyungheensis]KIA94763.1 AraC family transcriptional regulator [Pedobacter kyungheensis]